MCWQISHHNKLYIWVDLDRPDAVRHLTHVHNENIQNAVSGTPCHHYGCIHHRILARRK